MTPMRLFLVSGMVFHKLLWEVMKDRRSSPAPGQPVSMGALKRAVKLLKGAALAFLVVQTLFLHLFPISRRPVRLKAIGIGIYLLGLATAVAGRVQLGRNWANLEDFQVKSKQSLVRHGIYGYIRHPIYTGDLLLLTGLQLALNSWLVLAVTVPLLTIAKQASAEEEILSEAFEEYDDYRRKTKKFIPFIV